MGKINRKICSLLIVIAVSVLCVPVVGASIPRGHVRFDRITTEDGLSNALCTAVCQDSLGYLWVGTEDGLNRFNGREWVVYKSDPTDEHTISDSFITCIYEAADGHLWIGTFSGGVSVFDPGTGRFRRVGLSLPTGDAAGNILTFFEDRAGNMWIGTRGDGAFCLNKEGKVVRILSTRSPKPDLLPFDTVRTIVQIADGSILLGTPRGLCRITSSGGPVSVVLTEDGKPTYTTVLYQDRSDRLWVGTGHRGLLEYDPERDVLRLPDINDELKGRVAGILPIQIMEDTGDELWVGTYRQGVLVMNPTNGNWRQFSHSAENRYSLSGNRIYSMIRDTSDILWVGTRQGLNKLDLKQNAFVHFSPDAEGYGHIDDRYVAAFASDDTGRVWVGTDQHGAIRIDPDSGRVDRRISRETTNGALTSNTIVSLCYDRKRGCLWLGTLQGLNRYALSTGNVRRFVKNPELNATESLRDDRIFTLELDRNDRLWIGTYGGGVSVLDPETGSLSHVPVLPEENGIPSDEVFSLMHSRDGHIWVGAIKGGLSRFNPDIMQAEVFPLYPEEKGHPDTTVFSILEDGTDTLWLGTSSGLVRYSISGRSSRFFTDKDGLPGNTILGVLKDKSGRLWLSTLKGLCRFDPDSTGMVNFYRSHGLPDNGFEQGSYLDLADGRMLFGTASAGFVMFDPDRVGANPHLPLVRLSSMKSREQEYVTGVALEETSISIPYAQRNLSFQFDLLEYTNPAANLLVYKLEGMDEAYSDPSIRNYVTYTNIPAGDYTLKVRSSNGDGVWTSDQTLLELTVEKPWWQTWPFIIVACFAVIGISNLLQSSVRKLVTIYKHWRHTKFFSHFRILEKIGQGGMGAVFLVDDLNTGKRYALKRLNEDSIVDEQTKERFLLETLLAEKLDHPNIVRVHEKGEVDGVLYFVMDHVNGMTFRDLMKTANVPVLTAFSMMAALFEIVHEIHAKGVVHRDLKPENLMITNDLGPERLVNNSLGISDIRKHLRILDFGIAKLADAGTLTRTDMLVGSVSYLPPEYISGDVRNHPTIDYYSLGITLYEMVTGSSPYQQEDVFQTMLQITKGEMTDPSSLNPDLTRAQEDFIRKLIAPDLNERLTDIAAILRRINELVEMNDDRA